MSYDLHQTEAFIDGLSLSREAQHTLNEVLWHNDLSPCAFAVAMDWGAAYRSLEPDHVREIWSAFYEHQMSGFNPDLARRMWA